jgi:hypothetical protein
VFACYAENVEATADYTDVTDITEGGNIAAMTAPYKTVQAAMPVAFVIDAADTPPITEILSPEF